MKSVLFGWLIGLGLLASHIGCCTIRMVGDGCETGTCGGIGCNGIGGCGTLRTRIADRIRGMNCGSGCGEIYWDEQINEPPVCDPCGCDGEFECGRNGSCPSALGRLRNLWGYRYEPSTCGECNSCGTTPSRYGSGSCSTCAGNTHADYASEVHSAMPSRMMAPRTMTPRTMTTQPASEAAIEGSPTPASRPRPQRVPNAAPSIAPTPVPDANANIRYEAAPERLAIGSGVSAPPKKTVARPVTANTKQSIQGKPRLVTNPH